MGRNKQTIVEGVDKWLQKHDLGMSLRCDVEAVEGGQGIWQVADTESVLCGDLLQAFTASYML